jgi:hypothetical protein
MCDAEEAAARWTRAWMYDAKKNSRKKIIEKKIKSPVQ